MTTNVTSLRITTFNVNGLRAILTRQGFHTVANLLAALNTDIACFQETKLTKADVTALSRLAVVEGWQSYFSFCRTRGGYSGVATFCKEDKAAAVAAEEGLVRGAGGHAHDAGSGAETSEGKQGIAPPEQLLSGLTSEERRLIDEEGRCVVTDHKAFVLFNVYGCAETDSSKDRFQTKVLFYQALEARVHALLHAGRAVILMGDLNISIKPQDHCDYFNAPPSKQQHFYDDRPDRVWLNKSLTEHGGPFVDLFRHVHPARQRAFTVWNWRLGVRNDRHGSRVDYILLADPHTIHPENAAAEAAGTDSGSNPMAVPAQADGSLTTHPNKPIAAATATHLGSKPMAVPAQTDVSLTTRPNKPIAAAIIGTYSGSEPMAVSAQTDGSLTTHPDKPMAAAVGNPSGSNPTAVTAQTTSHNEAQSSTCLLSSCTGSEVWRSFVGSDHCPVWAEFDIPQDQLVQYNSCAADGNKPERPTLESRSLLKVPGWAATFLAAMEPTTRSGTPAATKRNATIASTQPSITTFWSRASTPQATTTSTLPSASGPLPPALQQPSNPLPHRSPRSVPTQVGSLRSPYLTKSVDSSGKYKSGSKRRRQRSPDVSGYETPPRPGELSD